MNPWQKVANAILGTNPQGEAATKLQAIKSKLDSKQDLSPEETMFLRQQAGFDVKPQERLSVGDIGYTKYNVPPLYVQQGGVDVFNEKGKRTLNPAYDTSPLSDIGAGAGIAARAAQKETNIYTKFGMLLGGALGGALNPNLAGKQKYEMEMERAKKQNELEGIRTDNEIKLRLKTEQMRKMTIEDENRKVLESNIAQALNPTNTDAQGGLTAGRNALAMEMAKPPGEQNQARLLQLQQAIAWRTAQLGNKDAKFESFANVRYQPNEFDFTQVGGVTNQSGRSYFRQGNNNSQLYGLYGEDGKPVINMTPDQYVETNKTRAGSNFDGTMSKEAYQDAYDYIMAKKSGDQNWKYTDAQTTAMIVNFADRIYDARKAGTTKNLQVTFGNGISVNTSSAFDSTGRLLDTYKLKEGGITGAQNLTPTNTRYNSANYSGLVKLEETAQWEQIHPQMANYTTLQEISTQSNIVTSELQKPKLHAQIKKALELRLKALQVRASELLGGTGNEAIKGNAIDTVISQVKVGSPTTEIGREENYETGDRFYQLNGNASVKAVDEINAINALVRDSYQNEIARAPQFLKNRLGFLTNWLGQYNRMEPKFRGATPGKVTYKGITYDFNENTLKPGDKEVFGSNSIIRPTGWAVEVTDADQKSYFERVIPPTSKNNHTTIIPIPDYPNLLLYRAKNGKNITYYLVHKLIPKK